MGNACTNCQPCRGEDGENGELLTGKPHHGIQMSKEDINYFAQHVDVIIRLQAWCRGVVTRERIRAQLSEMNPQHNYYMSNGGGNSFDGYGGYPQNMDDIDETQLEDRGEVHFKNGATYVG